MLNTTKIYLSGAMQDIDRDDSANWRFKFEKCLTEICHFAGLPTPDIFNPWLHFDFEDKTVTDREAMNFDLYRLRRSDLVVVNFNYIRSLGTMAELAIAYDRGIPILALNESHNDLHPWQREMIARSFYDMIDLADYVAKHYIMEN